MKVKKGATIGLIALASPCDPAVLNAGVDYLHSLGYKTKIALNPAAAWSTATHLFSSDSAENRVQALYSLYEDPEVEAVIVVRGGYGTMELLPVVDFERLSKFPKPFVGLSDLTVFLNMLSQRTDIPAIHGAVFPQGFSKAATDSEAKISCMDLFLTLEGRKESIWNGSLTHISGQSECEGMIVGGNLSLLSATIGTPWEPVYDDQLLFIEEVGEKPYRIHRMLLQLKLAGVLDNLKGVVIGECVGCEPPDATSATLSAVFTDIFSQYDYPVVAGAPFGHGKHNLTFRIGSVASVSAKNSTIKIRA